MIHGVLPSCRNDAQNQRLSDSSDAIEKQSLYLNWDCAQLWLICSKFSNAPFGSTAVTGTPWLTGASLNYVCITCDGCKIVCWLNFDTDCPRWQLPSSGKMPPIYDGSSWAYAWLGREQFGREIIGRFSPLIMWSANQDNLVLLATPSLQTGSFVAR